MDAFCADVLHSCCFKKISSHVRDRIVWDVRVVCDSFRIGALIRVEMPPLHADVARVLPFVLVGAPFSPDYAYLFYVFAFL